jgi:hypothetical protein
VDFCRPPPITKFLNPLHQLSENLFSPLAQGHQHHSNKRVRRPAARTVIHAPPVGLRHASSSPLLEDEDEDEDEDQCLHPCKRSNQGPNWAVVDPLETLGANQRNFVTALANSCGRSDVMSVFHSSMLSANTIEANNTNLRTLTTQHQGYAAGGCFSRFWKSVLEIQIVLRCQR